MAWTKTGNIKGPQGPQGPQGTQGVAGTPGTAGADGAQGAAGTGITFKGSVAAVGNLPPSGNTQGDAYLVQTDDSLHIWNGSAWISGGSIQGPPGTAGTAGTPGAPGSTGTRGSIWHSITGSPVGVITAGNIVGDQALDTANGDVWQWT